MVILIPEKHDLKLLPPTKRGTTGWLLTTSPKENSRFSQLLRNLITKATNKLKPMNDITEDPKNPGPSMKEIKERFDKELETQRKIEQYKQKASEPVKNTELGTGCLISETEYSQFVSDLAADPRGIVKRVNPATINALHAAIGIASEAGEILDEIKKHLIYGAELNHEALWKEMGDLEWYSQLLRNAMFVDRQFILRRNMEKLNKRHPNGFSTESAIAKVDAIEDANRELQFEASKNQQSQQTQDLHQTLP
jgi:NTP pyrophosphatase (non-canonical NTP hydrolase)